MTVTNFIWDVLSDNVLYETDENDATTARYRNRPEQFGELISQERNGSKSYYQFDGMHSTSSLTDENEDVTDTFGYTAFGEEVWRTGSTENSFGYKGSVGYYTNSETDDLYVRARSYQPVSGRWLSKDPLGFVDGSSLYRAYFVPNGLDPKGTTTLRQDDWPIGLPPNPTVEVIPLIPIVWRCIFGGGGTPPPPIYTPAQCCAWAKKQPWGKKQVGGLVCCHGVKVSCVHISGGICGATDPTAIAIVDEVTKRHEDCHHGHTRLCKIRPVRGRPRFDPNTTADQGECECYRVSLKAIDDLVNKCGNNLRCHRQVECERDIVNKRERKHCGAAGMLGGGVKNDAR